MKRVLRKIMVFAAMAALVCAMSVSVAASVTSPADQSLPEVSARGESMAEPEIIPYAGVARDNSMPEDIGDPENPRTGIITMLPVIVVGVAAGGTALLTSRKK